MKKLLLTIALQMVFLAGNYAQTCSFSSSSWLVYNSAGIPGTTNWQTTNNTNFVSAAPSTTDDAFVNIPGQTAYHSAAGRYPGITANNLIWNNALGYVDSLVFKTTITASDCDSIVIRVSSDDRIDGVWFNGTNVFGGSAGSWEDIDVISIPASLINDGNNYVCIQASDVGGHTAWMLAEVCVIDRSCCEDGCSWTLDGNYIPGTKNILGTLNNKDVRMFTNNIQRGVFTGSGNFGWNTASPAAKLHVDVTGLSSTTGIRLQGLPSASDNSILTVDASGNVHTRSYPPSGVATSCLTFNRVPKVIGATGDLGCSQIYDDGLYVGINMSSPAANLDISNRSCDNLPGLKITNDETGTCIMPFNNGDYIDCKAYLFGGGTAQRFIVKENGWVGVNRTPLYPLDVAGTIRANTTLYTSDSRFKKDINIISHPMDLLKEISGKTYQFKTSEFPEWNFDAGKQYGFIAQELKQVMPELVKEDKDGYLGVNYVMLIPVLTEAIKEQQARIEKLENTVRQLSSGKEGTTGVDAYETKTSGGFLAQNVPNPFSAATEIKYQLPIGTQKASIGIYDMNGKEIKQFLLNGVQNGSVLIQAGDLSAGMYLYTLIVDGKAFDTKRMVLTAQ